MQRTSFPAGETTTSRIKALVLHVEAAHGQADADALLSALQLSRGDLDDETRPIRVALWRTAAEAFANRYGRDALLDTWPGMVSTENLGVWTRVLRGAETPLDAFRQLSALGGEEMRTARWETLEAVPGRWRGRVLLSYDPQLERDGLLCLARGAELRAVPALFGLPPGEVTLLEPNRATFTSRTGATGQEYQVTWSTRGYRELPFTAAGGLILGAGAALRDPMSGAIGAGVGGLVGLLAGLLLHRDRANRAQSKAQHYRLRALERTSQLQEAARSRLIEEGAVLAGLYRLGPRLGTGANGVIFQATRLSDSSPVAIKLLRSAVAHDEVASDRLRREAEAMGLAWHPNVVEMYDHGTLPNGTSYLVMELLHGESLAQRLARVGALPPAQVYSMTIELCEALSAVHSAGVIHRDIKPGNVFFDTSETDKGPRERVKLLDFGIARVEWAETKLTQFGAPLGTPGYMSPEQEAGEEIDARSDLFALGAMIHECLTGHPPDHEPLSRQGHRSSGVLRSPSALPPAWGKVIQRAMAINPRDRYPDIKSFRDALQEAVEADDLPEAASPR